MDIRPLPDEVEYVLDRHHDHEMVPNPDYPEGMDDVEGLEDDLLLPKMIAKATTRHADAPVFVYKPLNPRERSKWAMKLFDDNVNRQKRSDTYLDLFEDRILRVENLTIAGESFDKKNATHLTALPLEWQTEVAMVIFTHSNLSEEDSGK